MSVVLHEPRFLPGSSVGVFISGTASTAIAAATGCATRAVESNASAMMASCTMRAESSASAVVASHATGAVEAGVVIA